MLRRHADNGALFRIAENYDACRRAPSVRYAKGLVDTYPHGANG